MQTTDVTKHAWSCTHHSSRGVCGRNENALTGLALDHDSSRSLNHDHKVLAQQSWEDLVLCEAGDLQCAEL